MVYFFMQLMDNHDGPKTSRYLNFIEKLRFVPFLYKLRKNIPHIEISGEICHYIIWIDK